MEETTLPPLFDFDMSLAALNSSADMPSLLEEAEQDLLAAGKPLDLADNVFAKDWSPFAPVVIPSTSLLDQAAKGLDMAKDKLATKSALRAWPEPHMATVPAAVAEVAAQATTSVGPFVWPLSSAPASPAPAAKKTKRKRSSPAKKAAPSKSMGDARRKRCKRKPKPQVSKANKKTYSAVRLQQQRDSRARLSNAFAGLYEACHPNEAFADAPAVKPRGSKHSQEGILASAIQRLKALEAQHKQLMQEAAAAGVSEDQEEVEVVVSSPPASTSSTPQSPVTSCASAGSSALELANVFTNSSAPLCVTDANGALVCYNPAFARMAHHSDTSALMPQVARHLKLAAPAGNHGQCVNSSVSRRNTEINVSSWAVDRHAPLVQSVFSVQ